MKKWAEIKAKKLTPEQRERLDLDVREELAEMTRPEPAKPEPGGDHRSSTDKR